MKKEITILFILLFFNLQVHSQATAKKVDSINIIENFILSKTLDSAKYYLSNIENKTSYLNILSDIADRKNLDYKAYNEFVTKVFNRKNTNYQEISSYINTFVKAPDNFKKIDEVYSNIKINQISQLRDNRALDEATRINQELESYINKFNEKDESVIKIKAYASSHNIVMHLIQGELEKGKNIINKNLELAKKYDDKKLTITSLYHLSDFLLNEGKLQEYIDVSEQSLAIESELETNSEYHNAILLHLIDAYIYKGGHEKRVKELISEVYNNPNTKTDSYSLYAKYLSKLPTNSVEKAAIFKKFGVTNAKEFSKLAVNKTKDLLNLNAYYYVLIECSAALEKDNFLKEALRYQEEAVKVTRKVYSEDLSKSLAAFQTEQAVKIKDIEIEHQKWRSNIFIYSAIIVGFLLLVSLFYLSKSIKQSRVLKAKNKIIDQSLKEKELLVKEVHHRVKNNFQIVSSLLELQTKGIEDERALELANEGKNRVNSMALIHQKLYQNKAGLVDFEDYIKTLVKELTGLYASNKIVKTNVESTGMHFDVDTAIPLGLIINEIITNSYKYAFSKIEDNELNISIKKIENSNNYSLTIEDNGPGLNKSINLSKVKSLGLRLVTRLVKQLHGKLEQTNDRGAKFVITFKDNHARKAIS